ncbi:hypothetical protein ACROYT_G001014 [Oculina patagonica]
MFKPVTSRLDTQIEATKKLNNKGLKELDPLPEFPIDEDEDEDEMPNYPPPTPIDEAQTEDEYEMPDFDPPPPIDEAQTEDEDEMPDFDPPPSIEQKRKKWDTSANQKELDRQRESLAEERRQVSVLLGKLKKSGKNMIKSGKYKGKSYNDLLEIDEDFTNQIDRIENQLLLTKHKIQRMEYKRVPFSASDLQEKSKKLKKTPKKTKYKKKPTIEESLFDKIDAMRRDTAPDSDREDDEWEGGGLANNYKAIYYRDPEKLIEKLDVICGSINAGNTSYELKNQGPGNPLEKQVKWDQKTGKILEIYEKPTGKTDAVSMQHDVDYSVCANKPSKNQVKCKNEADKKMVKALDAIPWKDRQWGHAIARNTIATKAKVGKAVVIERFNRTLKNKMYKQFTIQGNTQYLEILPKIVKEYNNTKHSSIKMTPTEASKKKNEGTVYFNLYGDMEPLSAKPKFKVGDKVRISKYKRIVFDKGYTPNWSEEMFVITKIQHTNPITYKIKDLNDEEIKGSFYEPELLKAKQDVFRIDKVIRRDYKKKQALVKWKGYNDDFNSWIPMKDLQHI